MMKRSTPLTYLKHLILPLGILAISFVYVGKDLSMDVPPSPSDKGLETKAQDVASTTSTLIAKSSSKAQALAKPEDYTYPMETPNRLEKPFSPTLEGTDIDGQIKVGRDGNVIVDMQVRDFFDYFLSAVGEVSPEQALDALMQTISTSLPPENAQQAQKLLDNYLAYKEQAVALMAQPMLPREQQTREYQLLMMEESLSQLRELRRAHMTNEQVQAFFGLEEAYEEYTLATIKVQLDDTMTQTEKAEMAKYHRSLLPEVIRQTEEQVLSDARQNQDIQQAIHSGDEDSVVSQLEQYGYSDSQTKEVVAYQRGQAEFDQRYQAYQNEKQSKLDGVTSHEERRNIISALQEEYFITEQELTQAKVRDLRS